MTDENEDMCGVEHICKMSGIQIVVPQELRKKYGLPKDEGDTFLKVKFIGVVEKVEWEKLTQKFEEDKK